MNPYVIETHKPIPLPSLARESIFKKPEQTKNCVGKKILRLDWGSNN